MIKRFFCCFITVCLLLSGCSIQKAKRYTVTYLDLFDTVTTLIGYAPDEKTFQLQAESIRKELETYHRLFDIYHTYDGIHNLKTVNDQAGVAPVKVDGAIIRLLQDCKDYYVLSGGMVNVAMGSILQLWHQARTQSLEDPDNAYIPDRTRLDEAGMHMDISCLVIDEEASTVYITDPLVQLDVGAVAKGWATQAVAKNAPAGMLISVGGNVCATGPKDEGGTPWTIGIQDPDQENNNLHTVSITGGSLVTSGDYQRTYSVAGADYHHIIHPSTLMPGTLWSSVSVMCEDSSLADALSTALFLMPLEQGRELAQSCNAQILWVDTAGNEYMTPGFEALLES